MLASSVHLQQALRDALGSQREQPRIAIMCNPGRDYVSATWAAWLGRGIAVPLCLSHPDRCGGGVLRNGGRRCGGRGACDRSLGTQS